MKKFVAIFLCILLSVLVLASCGEDEYGKVPGNYPLPLPARTASFRLKVWRNGNTTLIGIANLTARPLACRLSGGTGKETTVDGIKYNGTELLSKGVEVTVPEYSWKFLTVKK